MRLKLSEQDNSPAARRRMIAENLAIALAEKDEARIKAMSAEQKWAEFRAYYEAAGIFNLDIDRIRADQAIQGAPDSALDEALALLAAMAGTTLGGGPLTAKEFAEALQVRNANRWRMSRAISAVRSFSVRRDGKVKPPPVDK